MRAGNGAGIGAGTAQGPGADGGLAATGLPPLAKGGAGLLTIYERGIAADRRARAVLMAAAALGQETVADLPLGDLDRAVWALRSDLVGQVGLAGRGGEATTTCGACGARIEFQLPEGFAPPPATAPMARVAWRGQVHDLRLPRLSDLGRQGFGARHLSPDAPWSDPGFAEAAEAALEEADPALRMQFNLACPECGAEAVQDFDPAAYVWAELEDLARRLVSDVARLARHYGWSEAEITAMSPARRALYLAEALR